MSSRLNRETQAERALLVQVIAGRTTREQAADSLLELERLADTAGAVVVGSVTQRREHPTAAFFVGEGKLADIQLACREAQAGLVVFDNELTATQVNGLDLALGIKVIDRTELILQIFARRARSHEARLQVELAQLEYMVSRIPVSRKQQRFEGGIGMRGPGESPLSLRNEPMRRRIRELKRKLEDIEQHQRRTRAHRPWPVVCVVGYTNAGKSTLLNAFADADAYVDDRLFATLDTKTRLVHVGKGRDVLMIDTVGFIRHLPHGLIASFRSTLAVAAEADLLLVVAEAPHARVEEHLHVVGDTLREIGAERVPSVVLLNKWDCLAPADADRLSRAYPRALHVSATEGWGLGRVRDAILQSLSPKHAANASPAAAASAEADDAGPAAEPGP